MEADFDIAALFASLGFFELSILILTAYFASVVSGISGYGGRNDTWSIGVTIYSNQVTCSINVSFCFIF